MKIQGRKPPDSNEISINIQKVRNASGTDERNKVNATPLQRQVDRIEISSKGKEIASIIASLNILPEIREEKVQAIKEAVDSGTYKIDPLRVAEKMLGEL